MICALKYRSVLLHVNLCRSGTFSSGAAFGYNTRVRVIINHLYTLTLSLWVGGIFLFTFVVTPVIFKSYGRDMAGEIVGKLFPSYFLFSVLVSVASLIWYLLSFQDGKIHAHNLSLMLLTAAVVLSLYVSLRLHPEIRGVKQQIASFGTVSPEDPLRKKFSALHVQSVILNMLMLADSVALLIIRCRPNK